MTNEIVRVFGVLGMSLALLAGPMAVEGSARHRQYPPGARRCTVEITRVPPTGRPNSIRIRVVCPSVGVRIDFTVVLRSTPMHLGTFTTDDAGQLDATVTVPESVEPGSHHLELFRSARSVMPGVEGVPHVLAGQQVVGSPIESIPLTVRGSGADRSVLVGSTQTASSSSERSSGGGNSSTAPLTAAAVGLAALGASGAVIARRRRNALDTPNL